MDAIGCYFLNNLVLCLYAQRKNDNVLLLKERERMHFLFHFTDWMKLIPGIIQKWLKN